ncbi:meiotic recombination protein REC114 isoform X2 [Sparus aurata]|uniref:meiotic recombination protein REC114 isoform X2 n=1 Tax=Sparus aurata TaxID=8175 RepID=UPI0011C1A3E6|nr:meiotic recombination protein REC114 isoform X2 [Sparus aurata]
MASSRTWKLKRYGRFVPGSAETIGQPWKIFEATGKKSEIVLTIVESGYLLVVQGQKSLGEGRMIRMQFDGSSRAEAIKECSSAVEKLMEYMPVTTQDDAPLPPNQSPAEVSMPVLQPTAQEKATGVEPEVIQGSVSIKRLAQHFLGETALALPQVYRHSCLAQGDLEPILRICLLDPSFHAFVEKVEGELRKLLEE